VGHITYLPAARREGDALVVGLNTDKSVQENKGPGRPVVNERDRATVLSALECVDYIVLFDDKTPMPLLEALEPDVYAKGGDYTIATIVQEERKLVEGYGGSIAIIPGVEGQSTTSIIERIAEENK
jgi:rfaE bifunctional protein nucleotidyltransferase chain/domain